MLLLTILVAVFVQDVTCFLLQTNEAENGSCSSRGLRGEQLRQCAVTDGVQMLLEKRNKEWGWGERLEAEAIIALHLANGSWFSKKDPNSYISVKQMNLDLLSALSNDINLANEAWGHGKLAHYVLGLTATCQLPTNFSGHNLINKLQNHLVVSSQPSQNNKFAYALVVLALCNANASVDAVYLQDISNSPGTYTFGIDEAAMVYLAYKCVNDPSYADQTKAALDYILHKQNDKGLFGNEYSTALAVQVIIASKDKTLQPKTQAGISFLIESIDRTKNPDVNLLLSVLPAIAKKSYIDVGSTPCIETDIETTTLSSKMIHIKITVINKISRNYVMSWFTSIHEGQSLYDALQSLQKIDTTFSLTSIRTTYGQSIQSVCGMVAITAERQYWQLLDSNNKSLLMAADKFIPSADSSYTLQLTTW